MGEDELRGRQSIDVFVEDEPCASSLWLQGSFRLLSMILGADITKHTQSIVTSDLYSQTRIAICVAF